MTSRAAIALVAAILALLLIGGGLYAWSSSVEFSLLFGGFASLVSGFSALKSKRVGDAVADGSLGAMDVLTEAFAATIMAPFIIVGLMLEAIS